MSDYTYEEYLKESQECWHEFENGDLPDKPTDKCKHCGRMAKEIWPNHYEKETSTT